MSQIETIREMYQQGKRKSFIAEQLNISRPTIDKVINREDFNVGVEDRIPRVYKSRLDPYKPTIDEYLRKQSEWFHKQQFTAKRIWELLVKDHGAVELENSYDMVARYVKWARKRMEADTRGEGALKLVWHPGEAQCDFGEADYYDQDGVLVEKGKYLVLSFPYSNRMVALFMPGENCECVCQGLQYMFEFIGKVPNVIVFDNATGIGRRVQGVLKENEGFTRFRLHYGFQARFCNPYSGNEKGHVENCVGTYRRNRMVPPLKMDAPMEEYDLGTMLQDSFDFRKDDLHYEKNRKVSELFSEDLEEMHMLPTSDFKVARIDTVALNGTGSFCIDNGSRYTVGPAHSNRRVLLEKTAWTVSVYTMEGKLVTTFRRQYGDSPEPQVDLFSAIRALQIKANAWGNSIVREKMADGQFKTFMDCADNHTRSNAMFVFSSLCSEFDFGDAVYALNKLSSNGTLPSKAEARMLCCRLNSLDSEIPDNPTNVDLRTYDALMQAGGR